MFDLILLTVLVSIPFVFVLTRLPWIIYNQASFFRHRALRLAGILFLAALASCYIAPGTPLPQALTAGYTHAFQIAAIIIALAVPIALTVLRLRPTAETGHDEDPSLADVRQHGTDAAAGSRLSSTRPARRQQKGRCARFPLASGSQRRC